MEEQTPSPQGYDFFADVEGTRSIAHTLEASVRFQTPLNALARLEQQLLELPGRLQYLNSRSVTYDVALGTAIGQLTQKLRSAAEEARTIAEQESQSLTPRVEQLWATINANDEKIGADGYEAHAAAINANLNESEALKTRIERAEQDVQGAFNDVANEMRNMLKQISQLERVGDTVKAAGWQLSTGELVLDATAAQYQRKPGDLYNGYLFLTTHRLVFERREEVTSGVLFLQRKKQVSEISWEAPFGSISDVLLNDNLVRVATQGQPITTFIVQNSADKWQKAILAKVAK
jgi:cell division septum initiation protein DivIVA